VGGHTGCIALQSAGSKYKAQSTSNDKNKLESRVLCLWFHALLIYTGLSKKMDGILNRYNLKSTGRIYTFGVLKYSDFGKVTPSPARAHDSPPV